MKRLSHDGFGLVEALVALGVLALILASVVTLQASNLRATRAAGVTLDLAAASEAEATLRSLLIAPGGDCLVATRWPAVSGCEVSYVCAGAACAVTVHRVSVTAPTGRTLTVTGAAITTAVGTGAAPP